MWDSPILWVSLFIIFVAAVVYKLTVRDLDEQTAYIAGVRHSIHVDWKAHAYLYDSGHGRSVRVYVKDDVIVADDPEDRQRRPATTDEIRAWRRFFDVVPHVPF